MTLSRAQLRQILTEGVAVTRVLDGTFSDGTSYNGRVYVRVSDEGVDVEYCGSDGEYGLAQFGLGH